MNPLPHHPLSAKTSSNGSWPPAPSGHAWLNPNDTVTREDIDVRDGYVAPVEARDLGCRAGSPIVFAEGGFRHYARPVSKLGSVPSETLNATQRRRMLSRADDLFFLLDMADGGGFIAGTQLQRRFREHKTFILKGRQ